MFDPQEKPTTAPLLRPKDAATLIIVRRDNGGPRVLMGQRHSRMAFQPNKFVFPGGRLDPSDQRLNVGGNLRPIVLNKVASGISEQRARGLARAAIRETFEEAGILIGERAAKIPRTRAPAWQKFFAHGVVPRLDVLDLVARAITPPGRSRRFDARFFMAENDAIADSLDIAGDGELLSPAWLTIAEARALDLSTITRRVLDELETRLGDGPDSHRPIPFYRYVHGRAQISYL